MSLKKQACKRSKPYISWILTFAMLLGIFSSLGSSSRVLAAGDGTIHKVSVDLCNEDPILEFDVEDEDTVYNVVLKMLQAEDPSIDEIPTPEWDDSHVFDDWTVDGVHYDLKTPVKKDLLIKATWKLVMGEWKYAFDESRYEASVEDTHVTLSHARLVADDDFAFPISLVSPSGLKKEDLQISLDEGKTWEDFSTYYIEDRDGGCMCELWYSISPKEADELVLSEGTKSWNVWVAFQSDPTVVEKFIIELDPNSISMYAEDGETIYETVNGVITCKVMDIAYDANGGTGEGDVQTTDVCRDFTLLKNKFSNGEKKFICWSTQKDGSDWLMREDEVVQAGRFNKYPELTLYAQWGEQADDVWLVNFDTCGGSKIASIMINKGEKVAKPDEEPTREGYEFKYWSGAPDGEEYDFDSDVHSDLILFATWTEVPATPTPTPTPVPPATMPDVVGKDYLEAQEEVLKELKAHGFDDVTFVIEWVENEEPEKNLTVLTQDPEAGKQLYGDHSSLEVKLQVAKEAPVGQPEEGTIADFVERLYTIALGRASEKEGKEYWVKEIENGNKTGADCGRFFLTGEEFMGRKLSEDEFIDTLYRTFFGREPEAEGKEFWLGELKAGKSRLHVINGFIDSKEWCNICAGYGVKSGAPTAKATIASKNAIEFATRLYTCCLKREPEEEGLKYWSLALTNLEKTGSDAAQLFFELPEFIGFNTTDEEYVTRLYTTFMGRDPETEGMNFWLGELKSGKSRHAVMAWFSQSPEFTDICKKYGIDRGEIK